jgi:hypothetical protein
LPWLSRTRSKLSGFRFIAEFSGNILLPCKISRRLQKCSVGD